MQYFVSMENTSYYLWQIELLIESFKYHHLENDLIITITENKNPSFTGYKKNLINHKNKFVVMDFGKEHNNLRSLMWALETKNLKKPFVLMHPDMVLLNPIEEKEDNIVFNLDNLNDELKKELSIYMKEVLKKMSIDYWFMWIPLGDTLIFDKKVPDSFFTDVYQELQLLIQKFGSKLNKIETVAWMMAIYKHVFFDNPFDLTLKGEELEQTLMDHNTLRNIIHYKHGIPPEFSKYHFKYEPPVTLVLNELSPFKSIFNNNITSSTDFLCQLIKSYWA